MTHFNLQNKMEIGVGGWTKGRQHWTETVCSLLSLLHAPVPTVLLQTPSPSCTLAYCYKQQEHACMANRRVNRRFHTFTNPVSTVLVICFILVFTVIKTSHWWCHAVSQSPPQFRPSSSPQLCQVFIPPLFLFFTLPYFSTSSIPSSKFLWGTLCSPLAVPLWQSFSGWIVDI